MKTLADEQVAAAVAAGDVEALREAYRRYAAAVAGMAAAMTDSSEERSAIVREAFLGLWHLADRFDPANSRFRTWFLTLAHRRAVLRLRRRRQGEGEAGAVRSSSQRFAGANEVAAPFIPLQEEPERRLLARAFFGGLRLHELAAGWPGQPPQPRERLASVLRRALVRLADALGERVG